MTNNLFKNLAIFTGISFSVFLLSFVVFVWDGPQTSPPTGNTAKPIGVGTAGSAQRIESALNVGGVLVGDTGIITNASGETRPTCNSSTEGLLWYDYTNKEYLGCNGTSWNNISFSCGGDFIDPRDGNTYSTVLIGSQCWMSKNLAYLPSVVAGATGSETTPYYYVYNYNGTDVATAKNQANYTTYGVLYNYAAALTACPTGWHLPSHDEWTTLERTICTSTTCATDFPYDTSTTGWRGTNEGSKLSFLTLNGNNSSGFTALMSGDRYTDGSFGTVGSYADFWSSSEGGAGAWRRYLHTSGSTVYRYTISKAYGFSVRCLFGTYISDPTISVSNTTKTYGDASFKITHDTNSTGAKTFSSSNTAVATITNAGDVTIVGAGTTTITFNTAATEDHYAGTATATLTVVCAGTFLDTRDNQEYPLVQIGNRCWMQKNLNYATGTSYCYNDDAENCELNGRLYDWNTAVSACPLGWSLPTDADFQMLERYLGMEEEEIETTGWRGADEGSKLSTLTLNGNNSSGFTALMSGYRSTDGSFHDVGSDTYFWSSSEGGTGAWYRVLDTSYSTVYRDTSSKAYGFSVRCLKN